VSGIARALILQKNGLLTDEEFALLKQSLDEIAFLAEHHCFMIPQGQQSTYQAIDLYLKEKLAELSKKLPPSHCHQALLDLRLFLRHSILNIIDALYLLAKSLLFFTERFQQVPTTCNNLGLWATSLLETILNDLELLQSTYKFISQALPNFTADGQNIMLSKLLGLEHIPHSQYYLDTVKGKFESSVLFAYVQVMNDLSKMSSDLISFKACGSISLDHEIDSLELVRAQTSTNKSLLFQTLDASRIETANYLSYLHQILQPAIKSSEITLDSVNTCRNALSKMRINEQFAPLATSKKQEFPIKQVLDNILKRLETYQKWNSQQNSQSKAQYKLLLGH
jgi:argininosuccinate lyase